MCFFCMCCCCNNIWLACMNPESWANILKHHHIGWNPKQHVEYSHIMQGMQGVRFGIISLSRFLCLKPTIRKNTNPNRKTHWFSRYMTTIHDDDDHIMQTCWQLLLYQTTGRPLLDAAGNLYRWSKGGIVLFIYIPAGRYQSLLFVLCYSLVGCRFGLCLYMRPLCVWLRVWAIALQKVRCTTQWRI